MQNCWAHFVCAKAHGCNTGRASAEVVSELPRPKAVRADEVVKKYAECLLWVISATESKNDVRSTPESGHVFVSGQCPLRARSGHSMDRWAYSILATCNSLFHCQLARYEIGFRLPEPKDHG